MGYLDISKMAAVTAKDLKGAFTKLAETGRVTLDHGEDIVEISVKNGKNAAKLNSRWRQHWEMINFRWKKFFDRFKPQPKTQNSAQLELFPISAVTKPNRTVGQKVQQKAH